jgi:hypothetical protein
MSIGLSHRNGRAGVTGAAPQFSTLLILKTSPWSSSRISLRVSRVNSPKKIDPSKYSGNFVADARAGS